MFSVQRDLDLALWKNQLTAAPYLSYLYSYPHKTAYREFEPPLSLPALWEQEQGDSFFLYMHIPFCAMRCGFCNLFTLPDRRDDVHEVYINALEKQARQWAPFVGHRPASRLAIGGGTPTLLNEGLLDRLFIIAEDTMKVDLRTTSISVEASPDTVTEGRLSLLKQRTVDRVSMGIQSFTDTETTAIHRPQKKNEVERALELLKKYDFPILNLDLIYGLPGQTTASWLYSLDSALAYEPEEIFIYPLYTRENTFLKPEQVKQSGQDIRMECYRLACDKLASAGYAQHSMRRFSKPIAKPSKELLPFSCQEEGMIGLGCGARSYTRGVHYASRYGVSYKATKSIIADYVDTVDYTRADYGYVLSLAEQKRRFILKAILHREGLLLTDYGQRFGTAALDDYPELYRLVRIGFAHISEGLLLLTDEGLGYSDAIGDWLISDSVRELMHEHVLL
ncbi:STM4012 family radical SAM protein [Paenibacillus agricola]|uniref:Heme chaperone HemW n=1 Tax=Paenibacillus agricola TaxID=2716264 RepID=A0ABX0J3D1_9BACL|nr:STM4012 family radical SAM protein [Paenibacillus agricola]NHN30845.1 coproporphyrinogen III oxidase family protein [Paenibacillus agricola]